MTDERTGSGEDLRRLLLDAAHGILAEPDTSLDLRKIAERAGKSRTAPYLVFGKTEEGGGLAALRLAVAAEGFAELVQGMERALHQAPDPEQGLERLAAAYLAYAQDNPRLFRLMFSPEVGGELRRETAAGGSPAGGDAPERPEVRGLRQAHRRLESVIVQAIVRQAPGYLKNARGADAAFVAGALWALLHGVAILTIDEQWGLTRPDAAEDPQALARRTLRFLTTASGQAMRDLAEALGRAQEAKLGPAAGEGDVLMSLKAREWTPAYHSLAADMGAPDETGFTPDAGSALRRARERMDVVRGARILWVDDRPGLVRHEAHMLEGMGATVDFARTTNEALKRLASGHYDLVLSDIDREGDRHAGVRGLPRLRHAGMEVPVIFYVGRLDEGRPPPQGAFGITDDPEELLHLVFDVLERREG